MTRKKRGAPFGNHNALKHGFYSSAFKDRERRLLTQVPSTDLTGEMQLIRIANYRFLQALNSTASPLDVDTQLAALRAVNLSALSIASLSRAQSLTYIGPAQTEQLPQGASEGLAGDGPQAADRVEGAQTQPAWRRRGTSYEKSPIFPKRLPITNPLPQSPNLQSTDLLLPRIVPLCSAEQFPD